MPVMSPLRLNLLRIAYLILALGLALVIWPRLIDPPHEWPAMNTVVSSLLAGLSILAALGLRYPLKMLPILLFELTWKAVWIIFIAAPLWFAGRLGLAHWSILSDFLVTPILVPLIPWRYVIATYARAPAEPWRRAAHLAASTNARI